MYDEPFGAKAEYQGMNDFNAKGGSYAFNPQVVIPNAALGIVGSTRVNVSSENLTVLFGYKPMPALTLLAGGAVQSIEGSIDLRGKAYSLLSGYSADVKQDYGFGYVLGAAFEKPDIALRAALTYRSEIEHQTETLETIALPKAALAALGGVNNNLAQVNGGLAQVNGGLAQVNAGLQQDPNNATLLAKQAELQAQQTDLQGKQTALLGAQQQFTALSQRPAKSSSDTNVTTPQSVNIDLQTGIMANTLAFANIRWVDWKGFSIKPKLFAQTTGLAVAGGLNIVDYSEDQWSVNAGIGRKINAQWSGTASVGWDSGSGNPITVLGPTDGFWSVGVGARYSPVPKVDLSLGARYFWLGDANAKLSSGTVVGNFSDNTALAVGLKMGYHF